MPHPRHMTPRLEAGVTPTKPATPGAALLPRNSFEAAAAGGSGGDAAAAFDSLDELCDCLSDLDSCCLGCWCPCVGAFRIADAVPSTRERRWACCFLHSLPLPMARCCGGYMLRRAYRRWRQLPETHTAVLSCDIVAGCCLHDCSMCQLLRDIDGAAAPAEQQPRTPRTPGSEAPRGGTPAGGGGSGTRGGGAAAGEAGEPPTPATPRATPAPSCAMER